MPVTPDAAVPPLIAALMEPRRYAHAVDAVELIETHISWVLLAGEYAYKIKKPVALGFLDFSTLEARRHFCEEELRLNRRLSPALYAGVAPITGDPAHPEFNGGGPVIEYAVKMREFPQQALASRLLDSSALNATHFDALAKRLAAFHLEAGIAATGCPYGSPESVLGPVRDSFDQIGRLLPDGADQVRLAELRAWTEREYHALWSHFRVRQAQGNVRECHGDLHLENIVMLDGALIPFDCIEFSPAMRWIDVMSDVAFLFMDLTHHGRTDFAYRFLNAYLDASGDYAGLAVLRFYRVYRAMVRAKISAIRSWQGSGSAKDCKLKATRDYIDLAGRFARDGQAAMVLMHGLSGSGKSQLAQYLSDHLGAVQLRSDRERKRLCGLAPMASSDSPPAAGIYSANLTEATYHRLLDLARLCLVAGHVAVIDATCLKRWQRDLFRREATARGIPFVIVQTTAPEAILRARIAARLAAHDNVSEADQAVLTHQLAQVEALTQEELTLTLPIDTAGGDAVSCAMAALPRVRARLAEEHIKPKPQ